MRISDRTVFGGLAAVSLGSLSGALILGEALRLQPCYWCSFQRLLYMMLIVFGLGGSVFPGWRRLWALLSGLTALGGVFAAGKQSWMQYAPLEVIECGFGDPTPVERLVDWLSGWWPSMFMVTGLCSEKDWVFLGLSLANWSGVCFLLLFGVSLWALFRRSGGRQR
ncbi:MAG: disulfide bond formation protein B [Candidatus Accumulibacter sp.]|jgi:disulfide bond formation protein DsbB|nr:disulfide bond formation protein B [Accumulibacter sp.]